MPDSGGFPIPANWTFRDDGVAAGFERHVREQLPWYDLATGAVAHVARHYIPENGIIYDLGAATGNIGRALWPTLTARNADLFAIEASAEMAANYTGPGTVAIERVEAIQYYPFDVAIAFLTLMFVPIAERPGLIARLGGMVRPGGAIVVVDKCEAAAGYPGTVLWRLALAGKMATGVEPAEIVAKELSLMGVQRPFDPAMLELIGRPIEFLRFGEFAGWLVEKR